MLIFLIAGVYSTPSFSGTIRHKADSLLKVIQNEDSREQKIILFLDLAHEYKSINTDSVVLFSRKVVTLSEAYGQIENLARGYNLLGHAYMFLSEYDSSLHYLHKAIGMGVEVDELFMGNVYNNLANTYEHLNMLDSALYYHLESIKVKEKYDNSEGLAITFTNLGRLHWRQNDYPTALEYFFKALEIKRELNGCPISISKTLTNIGSVYFRTEQYDQALRYFLESRALKEQGGDVRGIGILSNSIASVYLRRGELDSALIFYDRSLKIREELNDRRGMAGVLSNMASVYRQKGDFSRSARYQHRALEMRRVIGDEKGIVASLTNLGSLHLNQNNFDESESYLLQAFELSEENQFLEIHVQVTELLTALYSAKGDYKSALDYHKVFHATKEEIINESTAKRMQDLENSYEQRQQQEIRRREKAEFKSAQADLLNSKRRVQFLAVLAAFLLILGILLFMLYRSNHRYNKELKSLNKDLDRRVMVRTNELQKENDYRARAEKDLKASEQRYRTVTETVHAGIAIADVNERITFMNQAFVRMLGYETYELLGETLDMIVNNSTFQKFKNETQRRKAGDSNRYFIKVHCKDGSVKDAILTASPLFDEDNNYVGGVAALTDITDLKKSQKTLEDALERTQEIDYIKSRYLKYTSDDLRIFLNNILGTSEILQRNLDEDIRDPDEQRELLRTIHYGAEEIRNELPNFVTVSQLSINDMTERNLPVDIIPMLERAAQNSKVDKADLDLPDEQVMINGNPRVLETVLSSLFALADSQNINQVPAVRLRKDHVKKMAHIEFVYPESSAIADKLIGMGAIPPAPDMDNTDGNQDKIDKEGSLDWQWVRKKLFLHNGKLEVSTDQGEYKVVISLSLDYDSYESNKCKESLVELLENRSKALYIFSNAKELNQVKDQLSEKIPNVYLIEDVSHYFNRPEEELVLFSDSVVLIDCGLEEPWTSNKTLMELKRQNASRPISFVEVLRDTCELNKSQIVAGSAGFDACISLRNCFKDLHSFLDQ